MNQIDDFPRDLHQHAGAERSRSMEKRSYWQDVSLLQNEYEIWELARRQRGVKVLDRSLVFPTFFTAEAVELLMTLPNNFWFWTVVQHSASDSAGGGLIDDVIVRQTIAGFRARRSSVYGLDKPMEQLSSFEMAVRVVEGVILFKSNDSELPSDGELVFNVMFQPQG